MKFLPLACAALAALLLACSSSDGSAAPPADGADASPATSCTPVAAASDTVRVKNDFGALEGTLLVPERCAPMPVVLLVSGSGSTDRDGNAPGDTAKPAIYRVLAESLRDAGVAVLRYDDPGVGKSVSGAPTKNADFRYEMEVDDEALFVGALRNDARFGAVIAAGHSQGSLTAILAAQKQPIDGFVSLAGAGRPVGRLLHEQLAPKLTADQLAKLDAAIAKLEEGELAGPMDPPLDAILPVDIQPYMISWMKYDPKAEIAKLRAPALLLQGRMDLQVTELDATLLAQGKPDAKLVLVDDMGHMLRKVPSKDAFAQQASYTQPLPIHPDALAAITEFVATVPSAPR